MQYTSIISGRFFKHTAQVFQKFEHASVPTERNISYVYSIFFVFFVFMFRKESYYYYINLFVNDRL